MGRCNEGRTNVPSIFEEGRTVVPIVIEEGGIDVTRVIKEGEIPKNQSGTNSNLGRQHLLHW